MTEHVRGKNVEITFAGRKLDGILDQPFVVSEAGPGDAAIRQLPNIKFTARLTSFVQTFTFTIPRRWIRKAMRKKRMALRRRRGRK